MAIFIKDVFLRSASYHLLLLFVIARPDLWIYYAGAVADKSTLFSDLSFTTEPSDTVVSRDSSAMLDCVVQTGNSGNLVDINWIKDGASLALNNRRQILRNGSLLLEQRVEEGQYQCVASLRSEGGGGQRGRGGAIISKKARLRQAYLAKSFSEEPASLSLYLGDITLFQCSIDGVPTPLIHWLKDDRDLEVRNNSNLLFHSESGVLEIRSVQFSDFGRYRCRATNGDRMSKLSAEATLTQNGNVSKYQGVAPQFVIRPKDLVVTEGAMVVLYCAANGRDRNEQRPKIVWLKDGLTIDTSILDSRLSLSGESNLRVDGVEEKDAGLYTCRAINLEDSMDADATLTVQIPPKLRLRPRSIAAPIGSDKDLQCDIFSSPRPSIQWLKNGSPLTAANDYIQLVDGGQTLRILGLMSSDEGMYQCVGVNDAGSIQAGAQLIVLQRESLPPNMGVPSAPVELTSPIVSLHFATLSWKPPESSGMSDIIGYTLAWTAQGSNRERVLNVSMLEANVQHLKSSTRYSFQVRAFNGHGYSAMAAQLTVETQAEALVPEPPTNLQASVLSPTSVRLTWDASRSNGTTSSSAAAITGYKLFYYAVVDVTEEQEVSVTSTTYTFTSLAKYRQYSFRVVAVNANGLGTSTEEVSCQTYSDAPSAPPQNVSTEILSSTSIVVRWDAVPEDSRNGIITGYKVQYRPSTDKASIRVATIDGVKNLCTLTELTKGTEYSIRIQALSTNGSGPSTPWTVALLFTYDLDESRVPNEPSSLHVRAYTNSIVVSWTPPLEQDVLIRGYMLGYGIGIPDVYQLPLDASKRYYTIKGLAPSSEYVLSLKAFNNAGEGKPALETTITREEPTPELLMPMMPPVGLKAIVLSSTTIVLTWSDSTLGRNQRIADSRYYTVRFNPRGVRKQKLLNSTDLNAHIEELKPDTEYEFSVKVTKGKRYSTWSLSVFNKTNEAAPATSPRDVTPVTVETRPNWISLSWQPPRQTNGQITGYLVFYTTDASLKDRDWVVEGVLGDRLSATIKDLSLETTYYFKVQARNSMGYGPMSPTAIFRTPKLDGSEGGIIDMPNDYGRSQQRSHLGRVGDTLEGRSAPTMTPATVASSIPTTVLWISIGCIGGITVIAVIIITAILCKRKRTNDLRRHTKGYTPANKTKNVPVARELKPPDLWIHDRVELRNRSDTEESVSMMKDGQDESEARSERDEDRYRRLPHRPKPVMIPVDQPPPPTYVTAISNGHISPGAASSGPNSLVLRPVYPRTQYTSQYMSAPRVNAGDLAHQLTDDRGAASVERPTSRTESTRAQSGSGQNIAAIAGPVRPSVMNQSAGLPPTSPSYRKPPVIGSLEVAHPSSSSSSSCPPKSSVPPSLSTTTSSDSGEPRNNVRQSFSTEELSAEMANLEGLMKDLSEITQHEFD